jgi:hypothetical protein
MKKIAAVVVVFMLLLGSAAFAEDGFSIFLGYEGGYKNGKIDAGSGNFIKGDTAIHGPNFEARYESGVFFGRLLFDYAFLADGDAKLPSGTSIGKYDGHAYSIEANMGYKVMASKDISVVPYAGFGYHEWKAFPKISGAPSDTNVYFKTPYAAVGVLARYEQPQWSVGLDLTGMLTFEGELGASTMSGSVAINQDIGWGARAQVPVTYNILQKKSGSIGLGVFLTPYFEYWSTKGTFTAIPITLKFPQYTYGGKAGIVFKF